ncbi:DUF1642 domain-containing protein [Streptococcus infantarius subsp. infantarius]|uniref:DUF1642 domain-containing protein n=1 Tax=Streptococcus infantarius TaxID=102684 RepID=UPI001BDB60D9|nr:DUF1642 domain-containing protein [Streptococcus infantarius]MBT0932467.1 DUF1642 domain-containing protein [Streptococcus infantarius subsp. infantarius]
MNKQEFQQTIKNMKPPKFFTAITLNEAYEAGFEEAKGNALFDSNFLDEPEKTVVPQFVADWYENNKYDFEYNLYRLCTLYTERKLFKELDEWFDNDNNKPIETLVNMHQFGYEVYEKKLYTVEIPNPNGDGYGVVYLGRNEYNKTELRIWDCYSSIDFADNWKQKDNAHLTESEIKEDFEWAWPFAEEV